MSPLTVARMILNLLCLISFSSVEYIYISSSIIHYKRLKEYLVDSCSLRHLVTTLRGVTRARTCPANDCGTFLFPTALCQGKWTTVIILIVAMTVNRKACGYSKHGGIRFSEKKNPFYLVCRVKYSVSRIRTTLLLNSTSIHMA